MSIKGFVVNGVTQKYDYNELDNKPTIPSGGGGEITEELKDALLQLAQKIAYVDANGADYYQDLFEALYGTGTTYTVTNNLTDVTNSNSASRVTQGSSYTGTLTAATGYTINSVTITMGGNDVTGTSYSGGTITIANVTGNIVITAVATERQATLSSISTVFTQGTAVIYDTDSLDTLKQYLVVTAHWSDSTTSTVAASDYTLSGTLTTGTSTITANYGGKTDTFTVTVTHQDNTLYNWDFTQGLTDSKQGVVAELGGAATQDSSGLHITAATGYLKLGKILAPNQTYEIDIGTMDVSTWTTGHGRVFIWYSGNGSGVVYRSSGTWALYNGSWTEPSPAVPDKDYFANSTMKIKVEYISAGSAKVTVYKGTTEVMNTTTSNNNPMYADNIAYLGGSGSSSAFNMTITGFRVYSGV